MLHYEHVIFLICRVLVTILMHDAQIAGIPGPRKVKRIKGTPTSDDLVQCKFERLFLDELWVSDIERHEALLNREGVQDPLRQPVAAGW